MISTYSNVLAFAVNAKMSTKLNVNAAPFVPSSPELSELARIKEENQALLMENTQLKNENERLEKEKKHATKSFSATVSSLFEEEDKNTRLEDVILKQTSAILELKAAIENLQKEKDVATAKVDTIQAQLDQKTHGMNNYMTVVEQSNAQYIRTLYNKWLQEKMVLQSTIETFSVVYRAKSAECDQFKTIVEGYERRIKEVQARHGIVSELFVP